MIKKFSVLYVGQIELENVGINGTPTEQRAYSNERLVEAFQTSKEVAQLMDELGYYCLWTAEHHFQREGYEVLPNLVMLSTWLATQTRRLKLGCAFNILPMWHPVRLAEDYAMADIVTDGRVIMGVGRGYHTREVESFGAPLLDAAANRELFEEQMEVLLKCFNEESWSHRGKHFVIPPDVDYRGYRLREVTCVPRRPAGAIARTAASSTATPRPLMSGTPGPRISCECARSPVRIGPGATALIVMPRAE